MPTTEKYKDSKGREWDIEIPDDDDDGGGDDGDGVIEISEEALEWLQKQFLADQEKQRQASGSSSGQGKQSNNGKTIRVKPKTSAGSSSQRDDKKTTPRRRVLRLG